MLVKQLKKLAAGMKGWLGDITLPAKAVARRGYDAIERDIMFFDLRLLERHCIALTPTHARWLTKAGRILANPDAPNAAVGEALDMLRWPARAHPHVPQMLTRERLDDPATDAATAPPSIEAAWLTTGVRTLAQAIYESQRFADLPALANALAAAGCTEPDILAPMRRAPLPHHRGVRVLYALVGVICRATPLNSAWLTDTAVDLAAAAGRNRLPGGLLDPVRLAVLADLLEEAGAPLGGPILTSLRSTGPDTRRSWVVDMVLGRL